MQERAGDFDPPLHSTGENPHLVTHTSAEPHSPSRIAARRRASFGNSVEGRMIDQVLDDAEVEIESGSLKHHTETRESGQGR